MIWEAPVQTTSWVGGLSQSQPSATLWADRISAPLPCGSPGLPGSPFGLSSRDGITATSSIACGAGVRSRRAAFVDHARRRRTERDGRRREPAHPDLEIDLHTSSDPLDLLASRFDAVIAVSDGQPRAGLVTHPLMPISTVPICAPELMNNGALDFATAPLLHARPRPDDWRRW